MTHPAVDLHHDVDGYATITLGTPDAPFIINPPTIEALSAAVDTVLSDTRCKGAVITGRDDRFSTGLDLDWLNAATAPESAAGDLLRPIAALNATLRRIETGGKPFVAALNGDALGAGFELALACHRRIAVGVSDVQLGLADIKKGLPPAFGGALRLARLVGSAEAQRLLLAGQTLPPAQAQRAGLIDAVAARFDLLAAARSSLAQPHASPRAAAELAPVAPRAPLAGQPAQQAINLDLEDALRGATDVALDAAADRFVALARGSVARHMVRTLGLSVARANALARRPSGLPRQSFRKVGVLGAGLMGGGIAWVCARAGMQVTLLDVSQAAAERGLEKIARQEQASVKAGRADADAVQAALARIAPTDRYEALAGVDIVVEAVFEDRRVKAEATHRAEAAIDPKTVFATNTSTLPISGLAAESKRPAQFIGLHFFSPVPRMPLLEIIRGRATSDATLAAAMDFAQAIGKTPIVVNDARGFYTTRVVMAYQAEAFDMLAQGIAPELIEAGGTASGMPVPPLALSDAVALDLIHQINLQARADLGDAYRQSAGYDMIARLVEQLGRIGKKAGKGFYDYAEDGSKRPWPDLLQTAAQGRTMPSTVEDARDRVLIAQAMETVRALDEGVIADPSEADVGAILGWGYAPWTGGPLSYIDGMGVPAFVARADELAERYASERLRPLPVLREIAARGGSVYDTDWARP